MDSNIYVGYFRLVDKSRNKILNRYNYNKISREERKQLKEKLENDSNLAIYCDCVTDEIELKIASNLVIYNYQRNIGERHNPSCPKYKDTDLVTWTYSQKEKAYKAGGYNVAKDYLVKLNEFIYQDDNVKAYAESIAMAKIMSRKIITDKDVKIDSLINPEKINENKDYFLYGFFGKAKGLNDRYKDYVEITCIVSINPLKTINILSDKNAFDILFSENRYYTLPENRKPLLIGGWFNYNKETNKFFFTDLWLKAVDTSGKIF